MADTFTIEIATPERLLAREQAVRAQIPAKEGYIGVLPGHAPLLSELKAGGVLTYTANGAVKVIAVYGGYVEVLPDRVRVLADLAQHKEEIDLPSAQNELKEANKAVENMQAGAADPAVALDQAMRAQAKVDASTR